MAYPIHNCTIKIFIWTYHWGLFLKKDHIYFSIYLKQEYFQVARLNQVGLKGLIQDINTTDPSKWGEGRGINMK